MPKAVPFYLGSDKNCNELKVLIKSKDLKARPKKFSIVDSYKSRKNSRRARLRLKKYKDLKISENFQSRIYFKNLIDSSVNKRNVKSFVNFNRWKKKTINDMAIDINSGFNNSKIPMDPALIHQHLKELTNVNLDLIQQQEDQLRAKERVIKQLNEENKSKDKLIKQLTEENKELRSRLERIEKHLSIDLPSQKNLTPVHSVSQVSPKDIKKTNYHSTTSNKYKKSPNKEIVVEEFLINIQSPIKNETSKKITLQKELDGLNILSDVASKRLRHSSLNISPKRSLKEACNSLPADASHKRRLQRELRISLNTSQESIADHETSFTSENLPKRLSKELIGLGQSSVLSSHFNHEKFLRKHLSYRPNNEFTSFRPISISKDSSNQRTVSPLKISLFSQPDSKKCGDADHTNYSLRSRDRSNDENFKILSSGSNKEDSSLTSQNRSCSFGIQINLESPVDQVKSENSGAIHSPRSRKKSCDSELEAPEFSTPSISSKINYTKKDIEFSTRSSHSKIIFPPKGLQLGNSNELSILTSDKNYFVLNSSYCNLVHSVKPEFTNVEIPQWRLKPLTALYVMEGTENLEDDIYNRRHSKPEFEEKRRKRWDLQRMREQRQYEKLRIRYNKDKVNDEVASIENQESLWPSPESIQSLVITEEMPVCAFGQSLPTIGKSDFKVPWLLSKKLPSSNKMKK